MEDILKKLKSIEAEQRWWSPEVFLHLENQTLKRKVGAVLTNNTWITRLIAYGTIQDIETFAFELHEKVPLMIISVLAIFLDKMYYQESIHLPVSRDIVSWYRREGWKFPAFRHESETQTSNAVLHDG
jgi:hypothetical protein